MTLEEAKDEMLKFVKLKTTMMPVFATVIMEQAEPVIRCKDCKWYGRADKSRFYRGMDCLNKRIATINPDMDYCSRAEKRTDE